ncbi:MAG: arylsulfatase [Bacteroidota bacterium]
MTMTNFWLSLSMLFVFACASSAEESAETANPTSDLPNIVVIYLDDLGYGDVGAYGASNGLTTPNMDRLAAGGVQFMDGHASSATCTPSRYALLTGIYPWRKKDAKILPGTAPLIIDTATMTLPKMLKTKGYHTGIVGKWHLGLGSGNVNWNERISPSPNEVGFDYSYILAATQDRVPTVYIEDGNVVRLEGDDPIEVDYKNNFEGEPTGMDNPELLKLKWHHGHNNSIVNGIPRIGYMKGGENAKWVDENMADTFLVRAQDYVLAHKNEPFFLYYSMQQPHVPRTPHPRFVGSTGQGARGDVILEADWCIGQFIDLLERERLLENTLIILSSDNGPVLNDGYYDEAVELLGDHQPAGPLRGNKYSLYEAGTRVPFITYWKDKIQPGQSDALVTQIDLLSSLAELVNSDIRAQDSEPLLQTFLGESKEGRASFVMEALSRTAYREGDWAMIPPYKGAAVAKTTKAELGNLPDFGLFDLSKDIEQRENVAEQYPEKLKAMKAAYSGIVGVDFEEKE